MKQVVSVFAIKVEYYEYYSPENMNTVLKSFLQDRVQVSCVRKNIVFPLGVLLIK